MSEISITGKVRLKSRQLSHMLRTSYENKIAYNVECDGYSFIHRITDIEILEKLSMSTNSMIDNRECYEEKIIFFLNRYSMLICDNIRT